jgi:hypothetical protein
MTRTIISIPEDEKKWLDTYGKRNRISSAEVVRLAVREFRGKKAGKGLAEVLQETAGMWKSVSAEWERSSGGDTDVSTVKEGRSPYGSPLPAHFIDLEELRRRAIAAAGRFESGVPDLSAGHDRYLADERAEDVVEKSSQAQGSAKKDGSSQ